MTQKLVNIHADCCCSCRHHSNITYLCAVREQLPMKMSLILTKPKQDYKKTHEVEVETREGAPLRGTLPSTSSLFNCNCGFYH